MSHVDMLQYASYFLTNSKKLLRFIIKITFRYIQQFQIFIPQWMSENPMLIRFRINLNGWEIS